MSNILIFLLTLIFFTLEYGADTEVSTSVTIAFIVAFAYAIAFDIKNWSK